MSTDSRDHAFFPFASLSDKRPFAERVNSSQTRSSTSLLLFSLGFTGGAYALAAWRTNKLTSDVRLFQLNVEHLEEQQTSDEGIFKRSAESYQRWEIDEMFKSILVWCDRLPAAIQETIRKRVIAVMGPWTTFMTLPDSIRIMVYILLARGALHMFPIKPQLPTSWFNRWVHNPLSTRKLSLFTNQIFHSSVPYQMFCQMALPILAYPTLVWMAKEQEKAPGKMKEATDKYHFLFFMVAANLWATTVSTIAFRSFGYSQLVSNVTAASQLAQPTLSTPIAWILARIKGWPVPYHPKRDLMATPTPLTLGASGVTYAFATVCALSPYHEISTHGYEVSATTLRVGLGGLLLSDVIGAAMGWRRLDHWAHLGAAAFGALYYRYDAWSWSGTRGLLWSEDAFQEKISSTRAMIPRDNEPEFSESY